LDAKVHPHRLLLSLPNYKSQATESSLSLATGRFSGEETVNQHYEHDEGKRDIKVVPLASK
jgi:hypothetical protein